MADTRDQMLVDFQAFTGIEDVDTCTAILTQHDWNLELAVNSIMHDDQQTDAGHSHFSVVDVSHSDLVPEIASPMIVDDDASASGPSSSQSGGGLSNNSPPSRFINFLVEYRHQNIPIVLPDSETVGKIKEMLQKELNIPVDKQQLKGLFKRRIDDSTVLRDLYLPKDNVLYLLTPDLFSPTENVPTTVSGRVYHGNDEYRIKVVYRNGTQYRMYNLKFKGTKTIKDVKQDVYSLINIPVRRQEWTGWPPGISDDKALCESDVPFPDCELEVTEKVQARPPEVLLEPESEEDMLENEHEDFQEDDLFVANDVLLRRRHAPLMSSESTTEADALEEFTREFSERYGEMHPVFYIGSLDDAIRDALQTKATERKLLAVYLHHDDSIQANVFCSQLLCSESVVNFLSENFLTWAWDMTHPNNRAKLVTVATKHFGSIAANQIRSYRPEQLPALLIISRAKATNEVLDAVQGHVTLVELMTRLLHAVDVFTEQKNADIADERERMDREKIKSEQDMAYQESLEADRKKTEAAREEEERLRKEREKEMDLQKEEEMRKQDMQAIKQAIKESIAKAVPDEPPEDALGAISQLRFKCPGGEVITRRFWAENTLQDVLNFLTAEGFHTEDYKVITTFPRRDVTQMDPSLSLQSAKLFPQETFILEEKS